ncbi:MAG: universal stress protein [Pyrinomonadaceae bacterium]
MDRTMPMPLWTISNEAGLPRDTEAVIISVAEVWLPPPPPPSEVVIAADSTSALAARLQEVQAESMHVFEEARTLAAQAAERLKRTFPSWKVDSEAAGGSPAWEVINYADQWKPDLVVVGSQGHSQIGRLVLGSVSQKVLSEVHCSVRIARGRAGHSGTACAHRNWR